MYAKSYLLAIIACLFLLLVGCSSLPDTARVTRVIDGDTIVIGGIIKSSKREGETGLPWLRKLPLLGWLFKVDTQTDEKEELLIFITPKIVKLEQQI